MPTETEEKIEETYDLEEKTSVITVLKTMPAKIRKIEEAIYYIEIKKTELISINKTIENDEFSKIRSERIEIEEEVKVNKQGWTIEQKKNYEPAFKKVLKDKFTNESSREIELRKILTNRPDYEANRQKADYLEKSIKSNEIGFSYMKRVLRSAEALVYAGK